MSDKQQAVKVSQLSEYKARNGGHLKKELRQFTNEFLTKLIRNMLDKADDALFEFSSKSDSNQAQHVYLDAMREVRMKRSSIEQEFFSALKVAFEQFDKEKSLQELQQSSKPGDNESLELIDDEVVEENMAIHNMAEKQERQFQRELFEIKSRMKAVYRCKNTETDIHPLSPLTIANAFGNALKALDIEFHVKLIIFKLFDKFVMNNIGQFYKDINTLFIKEKILPNLRYSYKRSSSDYRPQHSKNINQPHGHGQESLEGHGWDTVGDTGNIDVSMYAPSSLQQHDSHAAEPLLSTDFGLRGFTPVPGRSSGVIGTLTAMQNFIQQQGYPDHIKPKEIGNDIINGIHRLGFASVQGKRALDENTINMVSMIFDFILEDSSIPGQIKGLLTRLQIPFLKLALLDSTFLSRKDHTARQLLNVMARASIGWDNSRNKGNLYTEIESIVDNILDNYESDVHLFEKLYTEFSEYWQKEQQINHAYEERIWKTTEGKERVQYAKSRVEAWIHMWSSRKETRKQVSTFLKHFWKNTMLYCMHKYGEDSREWNYYIKIINALIWSTTAGKNEDEVKQLIKIMPLLVRGLNRGMLAVGTHPNTISNIFTEFSKCHFDIIEKGLANATVTAASKNNTLEDMDQTITQKTLENMYQSTSATELIKPDLEVDEILEIMVEEVTVDTHEPDVNTDDIAIEDEFHVQASKLEYGHWLEFDMDGIITPAKLAWKSAITSNHLFVGRDGARIAEKTLTEIAEDLRVGRAHCINQAPVFERALHAVAESGTETTVEK